MSEYSTLTVLEANRVVLSDVSWRTYESLLADYDGRPGMRISYDRGVLEILSPISSEHEIYSRLLAFVVETLAETTGLEYLCAGQATFKRENLQRGFEPDSCYYIQSEPRVRGKRRLDLAVDPPPDLAIEIDVSHTSLSKLSLYAAMGVPEHWIYDGSGVSIFGRAGDTMIPKTNSLAFPTVQGKELSRLMEKSEHLARTAWNRKVREWAASPQSSPRRN